MTYADVKEATIRPLLVKIGQKYIQHDPKWMLDIHMRTYMTYADAKEATIRLFLAGIGQNISKLIPDLWWTQSWPQTSSWVLHTCKRRPIDNFWWRWDRYIFENPPSQPQTNTPASQPETNLYPSKTPTLEPKLVPKLSSSQSKFFILFETKSINIGR